MKRETFNKWKRILGVSECEKIEDIRRVQILTPEGYSRAYGILYKNGTASVYYHERIFWSWDDLKKALGGSPQKIVIGMRNFIDGFKNSGFPVEESEGSVVSIHVTLPKSLNERLMAEQDRSKHRISTIVQDALTEYFDKHEH